MIVAKVGGSLFDWPGLPLALHAWLGDTGAERILLVPGGGATADAIRGFDRIFQLGEATSHWLAISALSVNAQMLKALMPGVALIGQGAESPNWHGRRILDPLPFFQADEANADHHPHIWDVTSDALALRAAILCRAKELVLLKSTDASFASWQQASETDIVDWYFATAMRSAPTNLDVRVINLRRWHAECLAESGPRVP